MSSVFDFLAPQYPRGQSRVRPWVQKTDPRGGNSNFAQARQAQKTTWLAPARKVLPGIEPGFRDSESPVITVTLQDRRKRVRPTDAAYPVQRPTNEERLAGSAFPAVDCKNIPGGT